jgi:hypothetical protein
VLRAGGSLLLPLGVLGAVLIAPNRVASLRLGDLGLAWWIGGAVALTGLWVVGARGDARARLAGLGPVGAWCSPALWLGVPPLLLSDGTWGLWVPAALACGAIVGLLLTARPGTRRVGPATASALAGARWPTERVCPRALGAVEAAVAFVFVWAQLAAVREGGGLVGWPRATAAGATVVVLAALGLRDVGRARLAAAAAALALAGLAGPLLLVALSTTPSWAFVWSAVASRPRVAFRDGTAWTGEGRAVDGRSPTPVLRFSDEQRVEFAGSGTVIVVPREGGSVAREVRAGEGVTVHPGDRLVVPAGLRLRFAAGRRIPDAPNSGPEWAEPPARPAGWPWLLAVGVTGVLGGLGLPVGRSAAEAARLASGGSARLTAAAALAAIALPVGWALYAAWLTPEVYAGGVTGAEVYGLAAAAGRAETGWLEPGVVLGALALGGVGAALAGARALRAGRPDPPAAGSRVLVLGAVAAAGLLACLVPVDAWVLLLLALGLAAAGLGPAAALAAWGERATPAGLAVGAGAGLATFALLTLATAVGGGPLDAGWASVAVTTAAALAVPVHLAVAWVLRARRVIAPAGAELDAPPASAAPEAPAG